MNIWVQKSRLELKRGKRGWHCKTYLEGQNTTERFLSGGRNSTQSPQSMGYIRQIQPGDLVLLFQVDDESIYAISQADSCGMEADKGSRKFDSFYLKPANTAIRLTPPLTVTKLREAGCEPKCFAPGMNGRIFSLSVEEFIGIVKAVAQTNPAQSKELAQWVRERAQPNK